jgi:trigger factor
MYTYKKNELKNQTIQLDISIDQADVEKKYDGELKKQAQTVKVEGFRPGKAPFELAKKHVKPEKVYDVVIQDLLSEAYNDIMNKEDIKPIMQPRIKLKSAKPKENWEFELTVALEPVVKLPDYKKIISDVKAKHAKSDIWVPGKDASEPDKKAQSELKQKMLNEILDELVKKTKVELSEVIIEHEIEHRLSKLLDDVQKIGLTIDSYLSSKGLTKEALQEQYRKEILEMYAVEYALSKIGDEEKISVDDSDLKAFMESIKDQKNQEIIQQNLYFYATMLRKQKILDFLLDS